MSEVEIIDPADPYQFGKPLESKEIAKKIPEYLASGGTIKRITLEKGVSVVAECDVFVPGEGSYPSKLKVKDTKVRIPRPEKKFGKK
jgi:hypothetical protein